MASIVSRNPMSRMRSASSITRISSFPQSKLGVSSAYIGIFIAIETTEETEIRGQCIMQGSRGGRVVRCIMDKSGPYMIFHYHFSRFLSPIC